MIEVDEMQVLWSKEMTIAQLLNQMENVEFCSVVRINGKLISSPYFHSTRIPNNAKVQLLPLVAGG